MPHSGIVRFARVRRTSVQNTEEVTEIDLRLGQGEGIELFAAEFGLRGWVHLPADDAEASMHSVHMSLHVETGAVEGSIDAFPADATILNSEIIAETTLQTAAFISSVAAAAGAAFLGVWTQPLAWNYRELIGEPLLVGSNLSFRVVTSNTILTANGLQVTLIYRYVKLSDKKLAGLFINQR